MKDVSVYWHIGVHKTATTWLQNGLFKDHPEIALVNDPRQPWNCPVVSYIVSTKERHYSTDEATRRLHEQAEKTNNSATKSVVVSAERLSGHPISGHYDRFKIARRIINLHGNQNAAIVVRNPVTLIPSIYQQMVREGFEGTYGEMIKMSSWKSPNFDLSAYKFGEVLKKYLRVFKKEKLGVLFFEDLKKNRKEYAEKWCRALKVSTYYPNNLDKKSNPRWRKEKVGMMALMNKFRKSSLSPGGVIDIYGSIKKYSRALRLLQKLLSPYTKEYHPSKEDLNFLKKKFPKYTNLRKEYTT